MILSKGLEQAVCIMTLLATQNKEVPLASHVINRRLKGSSHSYIRKIIRKLVVSGLVSSVSGSNGGFSLAKEPKDISLLDVVEALEGPIHTYPNTGMINQVFFDRGPTADSGEKVLTSVFEQADDCYSSFLSSQTVEQLIRKSLASETIPVLNWNESMEKVESK